MPRVKMPFAFSCRGCRVYGHVDLYRQRDGQPERGDFTPRAPVENWFDAFDRAIARPGAHKRMKAYAERNLPRA